MSHWSAVWMVAMREIRERLRSRVFGVSTLISAGLIAALIVAPNLGNHRGAHYDVGVVGAPNITLDASLRGIGLAIGATVNVRSLTSETVAEKEVRSGAVVLALIDGRRILVNDPLDSRRVSGRVRLVAAVSEVARLQTALTEAGLSPEAAVAALGHAPLPIRALGHAKPGGGSSQLPAFVGVIALFFFLQQYGGWILVGVAEEKSSRIAEVLLSALRPRELVGGKILGIGLVGLAQATIVAATAVFASRVVGSNVLGGTGVLSLAAPLGWFVLGFAFYGWAYAAAGSLVSRQSEAQAAGFPISIPLLVGYFASTTALSSAEPSTLVRVLAYLPPTAPLCMPTLIAAGRVAPWQVALSAGGTALAALLMARVAGAVYSNAILRTGKKVRWGEALRAS